MNKKYIVKCFETNMYWSGSEYGWSMSSLHSQKFDTFDEAQKFILSQGNGIFQIESVYIVYSNNNTTK